MKLRAFDIASFLLLQLSAVAFLAISHVCILEVAQDEILLFMNRSALRNLSVIAQEMG